MDLSKVQIDNSADINITLPDGTETDIVITVASQDSEQYRKKTLESRNKRMKDLQRGKKSQLTAEQLDEGGVDLLVACTIGWQNVEKDGKPLEFNDENVRSLYADFPWIKDQVDEAIADRANFMKR